MYLTHPLLRADLFARSTGRPDRTAAIDLYRRDDTVWAHLDLPGVDPDSVQVSAEGAWLTIRGERPSTLRRGDQVALAERPAGTFQRRIRLGSGLDLGRTRAQLDSGVLTLAIPVAETTRHQPITVEVTRPGVTDTSTQSSDDGNS